ncbi:MAG: hypothetical protein Q9162_001362 [Coniocarpon cinnabarinum]
MTSRLHPHHWMPTFECGHQNKKPSLWNGCSKEGCDGKEWIYPESKGLCENCETEARLQRGKENKACKEEMEKREAEQAKENAEKRERQEEETSDPEKKNEKKLAKLIRNLEPWREGK